MFVGFALVAGFFGALALLARVLRPVDRAVLPGEPRSVVTFSGCEGYVSDEETREAEESGPNWLGTSLFKAICDAMNAKGLPVEEPFEEDWGWCAEIKIAEIQVYLCFGSVGGDPSEWLLFLSLGKSPPLASGDRNLVRLTQGIDEAIRTLEGVSKVQWHRNDDWDSGKSESGRDCPSAS